MISFIETKLFTRLVQDYLSDDEYVGASAGSVRRPRGWRNHSGLGWRPQTSLGCCWAREGGGIRVIYFLRTRHGQIWMLTLYVKNVAENISANVLKQIKDEIDG